MNTVDQITQMNQRIFELAKQAGIDDVLVPKDVLEKFAELIVKECADIATTNQYRSYAPGHYVSKHFGVE